jgi:hypothetical protein
MLDLFEWTGSSETRWVSDVLNQDFIESCWLTQLLEMYFQQSMIIRVDSADNSLNTVEALALDTSASSLLHWDKDGLLWDLQHEQISIHGEDFIEPT